jgi:hypothetical protein
MSANNGVVAPGIRYSDTNYDANGTVIRLSGYHNGEQELTGNRSLISNGVEIHLEDFAHTQEMDDLYTMEAVVYDLAGNSSEANVTFSVNRFGSVYTFDSATEQLAGENGTYYTKEEPNLVITETNVDSLQFREITCSWNGELRTLQEGTDYTVQESGSDVSWKQYTYTVDKKNFSEEGTYILSVYSEDRASNASDNRTKGKKLEFVVDKTSPSILISGVENDGQYRENSREVTLDVQDNILLSEVDVTVEKKTTTYTASELADMDGRIVFTIGNANYWQNMQVTARDAAGNEYTSGDIRFLITSNVLVQFYMNKVLFYGTTGGVATVGLGSAWLTHLFRRRRLWK